MGSVLPGIAVYESHKHGPSVELGEFTKGGWLVVLPFMRGYEPQAKEDRLYDATPYDHRADRGMITKRTFWVIGKPPPVAESEILVRVNTKSTDPPRGRELPGLWRVVQGEVKRIVMGRGVHEWPGGRESLWQDALVVMKPRSSMFVRTENRTDHCVLTHDPERGLIMTPVEPPVPATASVVHP